MDATAAGAEPKQEIRLADYEPPAFSIRRVHLTFDIADPHVRVIARTEFRRTNASASGLRLDGGPHMKLVSVSLDGRKLPDSAYELTTDTLLIHEVPDCFSLEIETELLPHENTRLEGLYASGGNLCTQCEAEGFRHITYFLDRPDVLAVYDVRIEADAAKYPVLLSNGNLVQEGSLGAGRRYAEWQDPFPKPCYLFALVAGDLSAVKDQYQTKSGRNVDLNIYVRSHDLDKCDHAMQSLKRSMKWDEDVFGLEYDLDIYNIVAVSDFNMGAMENKGLNIFNTKYVLANTATATDTDFDNVEGVIGHEYFHNWTGNRVTCRDWFQLSLKEGLTVYRDQEFSSDMGSRPVKRIGDVRVLRLLQFPEDSGPLAHPVRPESYVEINNFYTTTVYNKGAEVIRMMARILGEETFRAGVKHYLEQFDGQAATCEDFVQSMETVSQKDLSQFRLWYSQAGTPVVTCERTILDGTLRLTVRQLCPATPGQPDKKSMHIPLMIAWLGQDGRQMDVQCLGPHSKSEEGLCLHVTKEEQSFDFPGVSADAVPSLLRGFSAPIELNSDTRDEERAHLLRFDSDAYVRWQAGQELFSSYLLRGLSTSWLSMPEAQAQRSLLTSAVAHILADDELDPAFAAELLSVPSEVYLGQQQKTLDPDGLHAVRNRLLSDLADEFWSPMNERVQSLTHEADGHGQSAKGARKLRNMLLSLLAYSKVRADDANQLARRHFDKANNMTDQFAALSIVCNGGWHDASEVLDMFYRQWKSEDLVIDKWFAVQAQSPAIDAREGIPRLMRHEAFTLKNPNRLRSLISMFAMANQVNFHASGGSGYNLLSRVIADVDKFNPQTAARMVAPLGRWARLDDERQKDMKTSLNALLVHKGISDDVRELVEKSLR